MDVINKLYSSVQTTVSQLSGVLPGNNVTKEYEVFERVATAGIGLQWKIYKGFKKSTKQEVSVFVFEKKLMDKWSKENRESFINILRRGIHQLTKIKHPRILTVQHPLEESRDSLAFAAEPILASLSNILEEKVDTTKLFDVEIVHGFQQIIDGLMFLHADANIVHGNLTPATIIINKQRSWKIFGLDFSHSMNSTEFDRIGHYSTLNNLSTHDSLEYCAPELASDTKSIPESDIYSLGMLMYCVYVGRPVQQFDKSYDAFRNSFFQSNQLQLQNMKKIPIDLRKIIQNMINSSPDCRPKLCELLQLKPFRDVGVRTLQQLDTLYHWDNYQKSKFYKGLLDTIPCFPHQVNLHTVIPQLVKEFVNLPMVPFVLPNILLIAKMSSKQQYMDFILPHLKPVFEIENPIQVPLILMQQMKLLLKLTPTDDVKIYILPLLNKSLELEVTELQELCLSVLPSLFSVDEYNASKHSVLPRLKKLCLKSGDVAIKVKCLICIGKILEHLDKWVFLSDILPFIEQIQSREPAIIMAIIGIYKVAMSDFKIGISSELLASRCIPFLMPICLENTLSIPQFNCLVTLIKDMFQKVEKEQQMKLEQLSTINRDRSIPCEQAPALWPEHNSINKTGSKKKSDGGSPNLNWSGEQSNEDIGKPENHSNPFVLSRQLTTSSCEKSFNIKNEVYKYTTPPVDYIYPPQPSVIERVPTRTNISKTTNIKEHGSEKIDLITLTHQDILSFLK